MPRKLHDVVLNTRTGSNSLGLWQPGNQKEGRKQMAMLIYAPYSEKDRLEPLGAHWNLEKKQWQVENRSDYHKFLPWISDYVVVCDYLYIVQATTQCWKCKKDIEVIGFGIENRFCAYEDRNDNNIRLVLESGEINIASQIYNMPEKLQRYLDKQYNYKMRYSKTIGEFCLSNGCRHCDSLQGNFYLFHEVDSPFWVDDENEAKKLTLYRIKLPFDIPLDVSLGYSSTDYLFKQYSPVMDLDLEII